MTDADHADDLTFLAITLSQAESLLHCLRQSAGGIVFCLNANKTEYMYFKQNRTTSTLSGEPLKFVDQFTYLDSNILFTKSNVNIRLAKT